MAKEKHLQEVLKRRRALEIQCAGELAGKSRIVLEIGCGHGHFLTAFGQAHGDRFCLGIDLLSRRIRLANEKKNKRGLSNLLFIKAEGIEILNAMPEGVSLETIFLLFPDPWPKKRHHRRRLMQAEFLGKLAQRTIAGGRIFFRTDHAEYFQLCAKMVSEHSEWDLGQEVAWPFEVGTYFQDLMESFYSLSAIRAGPSR